MVRHLILLIDKEHRDIFMHVDYESQVGAEHAAFVPSHRYE